MPYFSCSFNEETGTSVYMSSTVQPGSFVTHTPRGYNRYMRADIKRKTVRRLRLIEGQVRGLQRMVEEEKYCVDIIIQASAIKQALSGVKDLVLENHLSTHVVDQIKSGKEKQAIAEIMKIYKLAQGKK